MSLEINNLEASRGLLEGTYPPSYERQVDLREELYRYDQLQAKARSERVAIQSLKYFNRIVCFPTGIICCPVACIFSAFVGNNQRAFNDLCAFFVCCHCNTRYWPDTICNLPPEENRSGECPECLPACCCTPSEKELRIAEAFASRAAFAISLPRDLQQVTYSYLTPPRQVMNS